MKSIIFDTNVILSASINVYYKKRHYKHMFNAESSELFELLKNNLHYNVITPLMEIMSRLAYLILSLKHSFIATETVLWLILI